MGRYPGQRENARALQGIGLHIMCGTLRSARIQRLKAVNFVEFVWKIAEAEARGRGLGAAHDRACASPAASHFRSCGQVGRLSRPIL